MIPGIDPRNMLPLDVSDSGFINQQEVGERLADVFVSMLKAKHISGPFKKSPVFYARYNKMFPLIQPNKVRPIIDLSYPPILSYNDQIPKETLRKVKMASAPIIGEIIRRCQGKAILSKYDHISAYKLISAKISEIKYQGFRFLSYYFFECKQIFGSVAAVHLYDSLHLLLVTLALKRMKSYTNPFFLQRILDDLVGIFRSKPILLEFHDIYTNLSKKIGIGLAPFVGSKAFVEVDSGIALGLTFSCKNISWGLPNDKIIKYTNKIFTILHETWVSETQLQELNGIINFIVAMSPFLRFLRHHILHEIRRVRHAPNKQIILSSHSKNQILMWFRIIQDASELPIPFRDKFPPIGCICILSDAAGRARHADADSPAIGAAATTFIRNRPNEIIRACKALFPEPFVTYMEDENGIRFADKSSCLELIAILLGIIHNIDFIKRHQILIMTDSLPAIWALQKGRSRTCLYSSTITLAIATLLQSYESYFYLEHVPRISNYPAVISDALSRLDTIGHAYTKIMGKKLKTGWPNSLVQWLNNPTYDDELGINIWKDLQTKTD